MIKRYNVYRLKANTVPFYIRNSKGMVSSVRCSRMVKTWI
jgi:hypothetical protein